jgi:hypothetical protein
VSAKFRPIAVEHNFVLPSVRSPNPISLVRIGGVEVEDEEKRSLFRYDDFVSFIFE